MTLAEQIRALHEAANPIPWEVTREGDVVSGGWRVAENMPRNADRALTALLRNSVPAILEALEPMERRNTADDRAAKIRRCLLADGEDA